MTLKNKLDKLNQEQEGTDRPSEVWEDIATDFNISYRHISFDAPRVAEKTLKHLIEENKDSSLVETAAAAMTYLPSAQPENRSFETWTHQACHLTELPSSDFLQDKYEKSAEKLINQGVKGLLSGQHGDGAVHNVLRQMCQLPHYNLDRVEADEWSFKPDAIREDRDELVTQLENHGMVESYAAGRNVVNFIKAERPSSYVRSFIEEGRALTHERTPEILNIARGRLGNKIESYVQSVYGVSSMKEVSKVLEDQPETRVSDRLKEGTYIDVDGTVIQDGQLTGVAKAFGLTEPGAKDVTLFTGGSPEEMTKRLSSLGVDESYLPPQSKSDFIGNRLELLVDDTPPELQGMGALQYKHPKDYE